MSSWTPQNIDLSPRSARKARADAIIADSPTPPDNAYAENSSTPHWLLKEQEKLRAARHSSSSTKFSQRNPAQSQLSGQSSSANSVATGTGTSRSKINKNKKNNSNNNNFFSDPQASRDDNLIMLDMLDGGHLPTGITSKNLTANSDSIISLPPVNSEVTQTWYELRKAEAQQLRTGRHRVVASVGEPFFDRRSNDFAQPPPQSNNGESSTSSKFLPPLPPTRSNSYVTLSQIPTADEDNELPAYFPTVSNSSTISAPSASDNIPHYTQQQPKHQDRQPITVAQLAAATHRRYQNNQRMPFGISDVPPGKGMLYSSSANNLQEQEHKREYQKHYRHLSYEKPQHQHYKGTSNDFDANTQIEPDIRTPLRSSHLHPYQPQPQHHHYQHQHQEAKKVHSRMSSYKWFDEETNSYAPTSMPNSIYSSNYSQLPQTQKSRRTKRQRHDFHPNQWGWRKPAEEDAVMPSRAWVYLLLIGVITFVTASLVNNISDGLSNFIFYPLSRLVGSFFGQIAYTITLALLRGLSLATSFFIVLKLSPHYGAGSGIPEMKCVLGGVLMPQMLNWQTLLGKMTGLIFSVASGVSIGKLGPFIHMSCISAALVSKLPIFPTLRSNTRFQLQALSAAMAAGVGATFGAPLGGTMLAVEIMSTYYYIHWIPMALYCSITGYYFLLLVTQDKPSYFTAESVDLQGASSFEHLISFCVLGALCGAIGAFLVHFTKRLLKLRQKHFKNAFPWRTGGMLFAFAITHTLITSSIGGVLNVSQRDGVDQLFINPTENAKFWLPHAIRIFGIDRLDTAFALIVVMVLKIVLTAFSIVMPVPAGVFMPIFQIGALFGRAYGEAWGVIPWFSWVDPMGSAIVGAAAMTAGSLHTVSVAVVMLELTREAIDVLPLAIGVIVSYGVSKRLCSDLFSELIKVRKLPYILGLRDRYPWETTQFYEDVSSEEAGSMMNKNFAFVTPTSTRGEIWDTLNKGLKPWSSCALLSDYENKRLWGTISQQTLWEIVMEDIYANNDNGKLEPEYGTFNASERATTRGFETIPFLENFNPQIGHPLVDMGPMQMSIRTPFWKIITLFQMLSMGQMYVLDDGVTVGCISKADVISYSIQLEEKSKRKRKREEASALRRRRIGGGGRNASGRNQVGLDIPEGLKQARRGGVSQSKHKILTSQSGSGR